MEQWPKLLFSYGPFALLVFFVFVIEAKARKSWKTEKNGIFAGVYVLTWVGIFALCGLATYAWFRLNLPQENIIQGTIEDLQKAEDVRCTNGRFFRYSSYFDPSRDIFRLEWHLVTDRRLEDGQKLTFWFFRGVGDQGTEYDLPFTSGFYKTPVTMRYDRKRDKLVLSLNGKDQELSVSARQAAPRPGGGFGLIPVVYAASAAAPVAALLGRLESNDPLIRRDAVKQLAQYGPPALPAIEKALVSADSSYRLRVGVLAALNQMQGLKPGALSAEAHAAVRKAAADPDPALRNEASQFLAKYPESARPVQAPARRKR